MTRTIYIGNDHAGYEMKMELKDFLEMKGVKIVDMGSFDTNSVDYPDVAHAVSEKVREDKNALGVLVCGTGIGMTMTANKQKGVRAALCTNETMARLARQHNHANVLGLGARIVGLELAKSIVTAFLETEFAEEERHKRRIEKMGE